MKPVFRVILIVWLVCIAFSVNAQQVPQNPSPTADTNRHQRIAQVEAQGHRTQLTSLKGATLFAGPGVKTNKPVPLVIHFHGTAWLPEYHIAQHLPHAALITVNLGAGSRVYGQPFGQAELFQLIIDEAEKVLELKKGWSSITLAGFSAGYGAIRAILRQEDNFRRVNNVLLLDGIHASYSPEGKPLAEGGAVNPADVDSFVKFAREAAAGKKSMAITHSEIFPATYASTTECTDFVLSALGVKRRPKTSPGPMGMHQLSEVDKKGFHVRGYAGNTAPDHIDHLHAMPAWFKLLRIK